MKRHLYVVAVTELTEDEWRNIEDFMPIRLQTEKDARVLGDGKEVGNGAFYPTEDDPGGGYGWEVRIEMEVKDEPS
jgi:hypothetical protein